MILPPYISKSLSFISLHCAIVPKFRWWGLATWGGEVTISRHQPDHRSPITSIDLRSSDMRRDYATAEYAQLKVPP
jgi:hypothetical protein